MVITTSAPPEEPNIAALLSQIELLESRVHFGEQRRRAMVNIMKDLADSNRRLNDHRRAMLHILGDYEKDRKDLASQSERLTNSRRALMHLLQDAHVSNERLGETRKAMIHIMGDLRDTTEEISRREQELRDKQEQLVQAGKLATLGELTTGVAHELNNPLNNIGLYLGNILDRIEMGTCEPEVLRRDLTRSMEQVKKATEIITHLRTFGRAAPASREFVDVNAVVLNAASLLHEQFRLRDIELTIALSETEPHVNANAIQLEQVIMNLLTNARDAVATSFDKWIRVSTGVVAAQAVIEVEDSGPGVPADLEQRVFDPFFTTKDVGEGTGLGLSIVYGILKDHEGTISIENSANGGARFVVRVPAQVAQS